MSLSLSSLSALILACAVLAAPAPEPFVSGWSKPVDPDRDCKIKRESGALIIEMPGVDHDYDTIRERMNAPRILREFEGDFEIQLRFRIDCRPSMQSTVKGQPSSVAGGFLVNFPDSFPIIFYRFQYGITREGTGAEGFASILSRSDEGGYTEGVSDKRLGKWPFKAKPEHVFLRLERRGILLRCCISPNCKDWMSMGGANIIELPSKLKVSIVAFSASSDPSKVCFDQLKITQGKNKKP